MWVHTNHPLAANLHSPLPFPYQSPSPSPRVLTLSSPSLVLALFLFHLHLHSVTQPTLYLYVCMHVCALAHSGKHNQENYLLGITATLSHYAKTAHHLFPTVSDGQSALRKTGERWCAAFWQWQRLLTWGA